MISLSFLTRSAGLAALLAAPLASHAHQLWIGANNLLPTYPAARPGPVTVYVLATFGHRLPVDEPIDDARFGGLYLHAPGAAAVRLTSGADAYRAAAVSIERAGAYWIASVNRPIFSTQMKDAQGLITYARVPRNEAPAGADIVDSTQIHGFAKTLIVARGKDETIAASNVTKPVGHTLELVPLAVPANLAPGGVLPVQVLLRGRPYADEPVEVLAEHVAAPHLGKAGKWRGETDRQGRVNLPVGPAGTWMLLVTVIEPATGDLKSKADQIRLRATCLFEIPGATYSQ